MRFSIGNIQRLLASLVIAGALGSCGSATNNDQGASFTLLGYFAEIGDGDADTLPQALTGLSILLSDTPSDEQAPNSDNFGGGSVIAVVGLQNNLTAQFVRTDQVFFEYNVPGAAAQPPSTNYPLSFVLGAADAASGNPPGSSLPGGFEGISNRGFAEVTVLPAEIRAWMSLNRDLLPDTPFVMSVRTVVTGVSSAGDRFDSNAAELLIQVNSDTIISPTTGGSLGE